jgi:hypothetical protein
VGRPAIVQAARPELTAPECPDQSLEVEIGSTLPITLAATDANPTDVLTYTASDGTLDCAAGTRFTG